MRAARARMNIPKVHIPSPSVCNRVCIPVFVASALEASVEEKNHRGHVIS